jgi:hypothetical protein
MSNLSPEKRARIELFKEKIDQLSMTLKTGLEHGIDSSTLNALIEQQYGETQAAAWIMFHAHDIRPDCVSEAREQTYPLLRNKLTNQ